MPAGDVFGLDGFFLNKSNPITVSAVDINSTAAGAGITVVSGVLDTTAGIATLTLSTAAGLSTTPFYVGAKIAVSGLADGAGVAYTGYNGNFVVTGFAGTTTVSYATTGYFGSVTAGITTTGLVMLVTDTAVTNTTWSSNQTHGWFGGGTMNPGYLSTVDRIDFSNDTGTANIRGPLSAARQDLAATGNSNYGWFGGGKNPATISLVDRIDFSNDSSTASVRGSLTSAKYSVAATGNSNYGWFGGGFTTGPIAAISRVDRIDFSNDSGTSLPRGLLSLSRGAAATGNSNYGWFGGGTTFPGPIISTVDRIDFSNDATTASPRGSLSLERSALAATGNSNYGWFGGGFSPSTPTPIYYSTIDRIDFSNDSRTANIRGPLSAARQDLAATGNSNYGWFGGSLFPSPTSSRVDRIDFSNDSVSASVRGPLSAAKGNPSATSGQARSRSITIPKTGTYGWFVGGFVPASSIVDRIDFSNDTSVLSRTPTVYNNEYIGAVSNINYGWFVGEYPNLSTISRLDFSNDNVGLSLKAPLVDGDHQVAATGNSNYGWVGANASIYVQRIDYSNDLTIAKNRALFPNNQQGMGAAGNTNYGWFGSGLNGGNSFKRISYANDLTEIPVRGDSALFPNRWNTAATSTQDYGWWGGGQDFPSSGELSYVERINFSNDLAGGVLRARLSSSRLGLAAAGNSNYGWFAGGQAPSLTPSATARVDRIDYANDTANISIRTPLNSPGRYGHAGTSNTNIG